MTNHFDISVVIPCLNEVKTVASCVKEALEAMSLAEIPGEIIVADNGSNDGSQDEATKSGARVIKVSRRGYGAALMAGIEASNGKFVVMGDADGSYNFGDIPRFVAALRAGAHLAQGCRLPAGGGGIEPGAMPWSHRWIGNPGLTLLARLMFGTPVNDVYCGLRGFRKDLYDRLSLRCTGMEFATEMIIKSALHRVPTTEVPTTLRRDGRGGRPSHLRTFRDGWRTLRLFLLFSPRWVHIIPGTALSMLGLILGACALGGARFGAATLGPHSLLVASAALLVGQQSLWVGLFARTFAVIEGMSPTSDRLLRLQRGLALERSLAFGGLMALAGITFVAITFWHWRALGYGQLDYASTLRWVIPGITLVAMGFQMITGGFALSLLTLERKPAAI